MAFNNKIIIISVIIIITIVILLGIYFIDTTDITNTIENTQTSDGEEQEGNQFANVEGPGGCKGSECNEYCSENFEECDIWCKENSDICEDIMNEWGAEGDNSEQQPRQDESDYIKEGDGVWEKNELTFYINDEEGVLTDAKRGIILDTIFSEKKSGGRYWGWNTALEELNKLYPDNIVPDRIIEIDSAEADIVLSVHPEKEFCCDYNGEPITGFERSEIDDDDSKIRSRIGIYNIVNIENGFLEDVTRHELGHTLGIFSHVTDRDNDLMSLISPASEIKEPNLNDLYIKYRDRIIETSEEAAQIDQEYN